MTVSRKTKEIAAQFSYPDIGSVHSFSHLYVTDIDPSVIDTIIRKLNNMRMVRTNIGMMSIRDYNEIMASQYGFSSYDDMQSQISAENEACDMEM